MAILQAEQGGSALNVKSSGVVRLQSGASLIAESGACKNLNSGATTTATAYEVFGMGTNKMWYMPGSAGSPAFSGSPGDLLWLPNSASTALWLNVSDGAAGSKWSPLYMGTGSQLPIA